MKVNVRELSGAALDWVVAKALGRNVWFVEDGSDRLGSYINGGDFSSDWRPSERWCQGGPLIGKHGLWLSDDNDDPEQPHISSIRGAHMQVGPTPLIAAMRALVAAKLGDEIEVPDELAQQTETGND